MFVEWVVGTRVELFTFCLSCVEWSLVSPSVTRERAHLPNDACRTNLMFLILVILLVLRWGKRLDGQASLWPLWQALQSMRVRK